MNQIINPKVLIPLVSCIPEVSTKWSVSDYLGAFRVRWGIGRSNYRIDPGLYKIGEPDKNSDVFVTANYKLSFDVLRRNLKELNTWILVLDTKGINVWCAAGKGTFGNNELIQRIKLSSLHEIVSHRRLIIPQLGAVGIAAHIIKKQTGFRILYGPVSATDIPAFIENGYKTTSQMRYVKFTLYDRLKLIPVELIVNKKYLLGALVVIILISGFSGKSYSINQIIHQLPVSFIYVFSIYLSGVLLAPLLLPYLPARSFAIKGFYSGIVVYLIIFAIQGYSGSLPEIISWLLLISAGSSFLTLNFTGTSTYTSLSGVKKEMRVAISVQIVSILAGIILLIIGRISNI